MEIQIEVAKFKNEVNLLNGIAEKKSGVAALSSLLIETTENGIRMTGTDLDTTVRVEAEATVKTEGAICVPAKKLCDIVKSLDNGIAKIKVQKDGWVILTCNTSKFRLSGLGKEEFPAIPEIEADEVIMDGATLTSLIKHTCFAVTQEESRYVLNGAKIEVADGTVTMVATDGHRIAIMTETIDDIEAKLDILVPKRALMEVSKFAGNEVVITDSKNHIKFESGTRVLISRKIAGNFPNYKMAIPKDNNIKVEFDGEEMVKGLKRASLNADESNRAVKIEIQKDKMVITSNSNEGDSEEVVKCKTEELPEAGLTIYLNWVYLTEFLSICETPSLRIQDGMHAVEIVEGTAINIVMPLRVG